MTVSTPYREDESERVYSWRLREFLELGIQVQDAELLAILDHVDLELARNLGVKGCAPELIVRILL